MSKRTMKNNGPVVAVVSIVTVLSGIFLYKWLNTEVDLLHYDENLFTLHSQHDKILWEKNHPLQLSFSMRHHTSKTEHLKQNFQSFKQIEDLLCAFIVNGKEFEINGFTIQHHGNPKITETDNGNIVFREKDNTDFPTFRFYTEDIDNLGYYNRTNFYSVFYTRQYSKQTVQVQSKQVSGGWYTLFDQHPIFKRIHHVIKFRIEQFFQNDEIR